jgi:PilZ domain
MPIMHVSEEDLELYFLGRLPSDQLSAVESHLTDCSSCTNRLSNVTGVFLKLLKLKNRHQGNYEGIEKRREHRIPLDSPGQMQAFSPFSPEKFRVQMMDVSRNGLKLRTPQFVARGAMVQVVIEEAIILGEVRYCIPAEGEFDMGIQILDLIRKARV